MSAHPSTTGQEFGWMLANFVRTTDGVREAVAVSSDGLLIAGSAGLNRSEADHLAAIVSSLVSLGRSAARRYEFEGLKLVMIEMVRGFLLVSTIAGGSCIGVVADGEGDLGLIGYETASLAERFGPMLTPALISESRRHLPR
ncbi:MAG: roadblock/LC7 domain-containing protein [Kineosporiaceae bacterium]|nr:roadblock/LC7 domain-containing protein [Kineosporiaceae bacterium]MBK7622096.1 roadblock/LC7 domain-containing protein [Kineosporiaceae bacterium]MBK8074406.1 roadblock/LC7 domain-containing protein [Kineosporiaceae bacterium]